MQTGDWRDRQKMTTQSGGRLRRKCDVVEMNDRISNLPNSIIQHILSFIPTKDAAQTTILSKRWNNIWMGTPVVDINLLHLPVAVSETYKQNFMNFMDRLLLLHDGCNIDKLNLSFCFYLDSARITPWTWTLLTQHKVKYLDLGINCSIKPWLFPSSFFTCESLTTLKISIHSGIQIPISVCMLNLKVLVLDYTVLSCEHLTQQVIFTFPNLEEFSIRRCLWKNMKSVRICAPRLRTLAIHDFIGGDCEVSIDAPSLISVSFSGALVPQYSLCNVSALVNAYIDINASNASEHHVTKFFREISTMKNLSVSSSTISRVGHFLKKEDNRLATTLASFLSNLRAIKVRSFQGDDRQVFVIELFLKNTSVLERMTIRYSTGLSATKKNQITRLLLNLPKGSTCCTMDFQ